jgi:hypothetical protein
MSPHTVGPFTTAMDLSLNLYIDNILYPAIHGAIQQRRRSMGVLHCVISHISASQIRIVGMHKYLVPRDYDLTFFHQWSVPSSRWSAVQSLNHLCLQARNEEKAQSMLYRFREAQAAELGLGTRSDRRPKMASACKSLRECERWRGEILREISRKVSKIQDGGYRLSPFLVNSICAYSALQPV